MYHDTHKDVGIIDCAGHDLFWNDITYEMEPVKRSNVTGKVVAKEFRHDALTQKQ